MKIQTLFLSSAICACAAHAALRPPAVPLVAVEPHFSVWSAADRLYDKDTTHWSGVAQPLTILLDADGTTYRLCGRGRGKDVETPVLQQTGLRVGATTTSYSFSDGKGLSAEVDFITPRMTDDLDVFSRPVTYLTVRISSFFITGFLSVYTDVGIIAHPVGKEKPGYNYHNM